MASLKVESPADIYIPDVPRLLFSSPCFERRGEPGVAAFDLSYHKNTAAQGWASMRQRQAWHPLHLMADNIAIPSTVLDFPTPEEFHRELEQGYDAVCITFGAVSTGMLAKMIRHIRRTSPHIPIVVGGYGTDLLDKSDDPLVREIRESVDEICRGEGVSFLKDFVARRFGISHDSPFRQDLPLQEFGFGGLPWAISKGLVLVSALGCKNQCQFCSTSHHFQGRKTSLSSPISLCETLVGQLASHPKSADVLVYDEDFLADRDAAMELARLFGAQPTLGARNVRLTVFASIRSLQQYTIDELSALRIGMVFIGIESLTGLASVDGCARAKRGLEDPAALFQRLHAAGIHTMASVIGGWDGQSPDELEWEAKRFTALNPTLYQVMPLTALPGTPLWDKHKEDGRFDSDNSWRHPEIWGHRLQSWIDSTNRMLVEEGGPWFFRMAANHLEAVQSKLPVRLRSDNEKRLSALEPLALASGFFFRGSGFRNRWKRFTKRRFRSYPIQSLVRMAFGVLLCAGLWLSHQVVGRIRAMVGATDVPRSVRTPYPGTRAAT
ncbi:MAG: hypothetical protein IPN71_17895 [Fibrobacteres bacterium]|jgi:hypothetical protein|nr:hypothetical protein [Fibrobacterota bacterium]